MKDFDFSNLGYDELCELGRTIEKLKKNFIDFRDCYVVDDLDGEPHLCTRSNGTCYYGDTYTYFSFFRDVFTGEHVTKIPNEEVDEKYKLLFYLDKENMHHSNKIYDYDYYLDLSCTRFEGKIYRDDELHPLRELVPIWETVKMTILESRLDEEQAKLDKKRKELGLTLKKNHNN